MTVGTTHSKFAVALLCMAAGGAWATEYGTVISSTPVTAQVPVPQRQCTDEQVYYQQPNTGAGALIGAIAGAAVGNSVGSGMGRAAATGIGLVAGSAIGDRVEANGNPPASSTVQRCRTVTRYENRVIGYDVVYDYQGMRRSTRLAQAPTGDRIALEVNVAPAGARAAAPPPVYAETPDTVVDDQAPPQVAYGQPVYGQPVYGPQVYYGSPAYYNPWPYYAVAPLFWGRVGWGWGGGGHHHR